MNRRLLIPLLSLVLSTSFADVTKGGFGAERDLGTRAEASKETSKKPADSKRTSYPFHGTLAAIDSAGSSITLEGKKKNRVIAVTPETRVFRNGAKAKLGDGVAGERVTGTVRRNAAGQEEAITVRFAPKAPSK